MFITAYKVLLVFHARPAHGATTEDGARVALDELKRRTPDSAWAKLDGVLVFVNNECFQVKLNAGELSVERARPLSHGGGDASSETVRREGDSGGA